MILYNSDFNQYTIFIQPCKTEWDPTVLRFSYTFHMYIS